MNEWKNEWGFKGTSARKGHLVPVSGPLSLLKNRVRSEPSDPKRSKGSFKSMVSIDDRSTHPPSFIWLARRVPHQLRVPWEVPAPIEHHWASQQGVSLAAYVIQWKNEWGFKGTSARKGHLVPVSGPLSLLKNRVRSEPSDPKRSKGSFKCMVSIDRSTHPPSFIWLARRVPHQLRVPWEVPAPIAHHWASQQGVSLAAYVIHWNKQSQNKRVKS